MILLNEDATKIIDNRHILKKAGKAISKDIKNNPRYKNKTDDEKSEYLQKKKEEYGIDNYNRFDSFGSGNAFESLLQTNPEEFNTKYLESLKKSKNIVEDFSFFFDVTRNIVDLNSNHSNDFSDRNMVTSRYGAFNTDISVLKKLGYSDTDIVHMVNEKYLPQSLTEEGCRSLINIAILQNKQLYSHILNAIKSNNGLFMYTEAMISSNPNADASDAIKAFKQDLKGNISKYKRDFGFDFREIGGCCVFTSSDTELEDDMPPTKFLSNIFKYDAIVLSHGNDVNIYEFNNNRKSDKDDEGNLKDNRDKDGVGLFFYNFKNNFEKYLDVIEGIHERYTKIYNNYRPTNNEDYVNQQKFVKLLNSIGRFYNKGIDLLYDESFSYKDKDILVQLRKDLQEIQNNTIKMKSKIDGIMVHGDIYSFIELLGKYIDHSNYKQDKTNSKSINKKRQSVWVIQPVNTLSSRNITNVNELLKTLKKEGFKKILLGVCNPGQHIPPMLKDRDIEVTYSNYSMFVESYSDLDNELMILEQLVEECDSISMVMNESVGDVLKTLAKKAISLIQTLWKKLIGFIVKIIQMIKEKLSKLFATKSDNKSIQNAPKPVEANCITMQGGKPVLQKVKCKNQKELYEFYKKANIDLNQYMKRKENEETAYIKKLQSLIDSGRLKRNSDNRQVHESLFININLI